MAKPTPTVNNSEMGELLDSLTVVVGGNFPAEYVRREVMAVARKALKLHNDALLAAAREGERLREAVDAFMSCGNDKCPLCAMEFRDALAQGEQQHGA